MANDFKIVITAVDKATASIRKINQSMSRLTKPFDNLKTSFVRLSKESGLNAVGKSIADIGKAAKKATGEFVSFSLKSTAMVGASVAAVTALATEWGKLGWEISRTAATIGISTSDLQSLRGAAEMAGVSSSDLTSGLKSLGDTMEDALYGRNQQALVLLSKLGVQINKTASGAIDSAKGFDDLADSISRIKSPQVQGLIARSFGLEASLPLLRHGSKAIHEYQRQALALGAVMSPEQIARAERYGQAFEQFKLSSMALRNSIGDRLIPVIQPLLEQLTSWISANKDLIATKVGEFVKQFGDWLMHLDFKKIGNDIRSVADSVSKMVDALGGWKNIAIGVATIMAGQLIASVLSLGGALFTAAGSAALLIGRLGSLAGLSGSGALAFLGSAGQVGLAGVGGYFAGGFLNQGIDYLTNKATGQSSLGAWMNDKINGQGGGSLPLGVRQNNPGNLRRWGGVPTANGFASFSSNMAGLSAMKKQLELYGGRGINTMGKIIATYAPDSENNTASYISDVARQTGFKQDQTLNLSDPGTMKSLMSAMIRHEQGGDFYKNQLNQLFGGQQNVNVQVDFKNAPPGTRAQISTTPGVNASARIAHQTLGAMTP